MMGFWKVWWWVVAVMTAFGFLLEANRHGESKKGAQNVGAALGSLMLAVPILYFAAQAIWGKG